MIIMNVREMIKKEMLNEIIDEKESEPHLLEALDMCNKDLFRKTDEYFFTCNLLPKKVEEYFSHYDIHYFDNRSIIQSISSFYKQDSHYLLEKFQIQKSKLYGKEFRSDINYFREKYEEFIDLALFQIWLIEEGGD